MNKISKNEKGFSAVEIMLVLVIVILIGAVGWLVYDRNKTNSNKSSLATKSTVNEATTNASTSTANPYAGWKTGTLQYEQISYQYPSNWSLSGSSLSSSQQKTEQDISAPSDLGDITYLEENDGFLFSPGEDTYTLHSSSGNQISLTAGPGAAFIPFQTTGTSVPIPFSGSIDYISFGTYNSGELSANFLPSEACLGSTNSTTGGGKADITSKNISYTDTSGSNNPTPTGAATDGFCYIPKQPETVAAYESDPDFATAKLILESMKYTN